MQRLLVALLLLLLPLNAWAGGGGPEPQHLSRFRCLAAIEIWGPQGIETGYYALAPGPLDPGSASIRFRAPAGALVHVRTYRAWWEQEQPYAAKLQDAIGAQEQQAEALDNARWRALALGAPALWPLAGGLAAAIAHPISGARGTDPYQLPWPALFDPVPDPATPQLRLGPHQADGVSEIQIINPDPAYPLGSWGLVIEYPAGPPTGPLPQSTSYARVEDFKPELLIRYYTDGAQPPLMRVWQRPASVDLADLLTAWRAQSEHHVVLERPELQFAAHCWSGADGHEMERVATQPRTWLQSLPVVLLSWTGWLLGGWLLTLPGKSTRRKAVLLAGGWIAGLGIAALAFPLYGLGFLPGAAVVNVLWARWGLGPATFQRWSWIVVIWMLCSLPGLALLDQLGLVPG